MKKRLYFITLALVVTVALGSCIKDKNKPAPEAPPEETPTPPEVITTFRLYIWDSLSNVPISGSPFTLKDPDGDGGQPAAFLNSGADSVITLNANSTYKTRVVILDETANPTDSTSNDIETEEGYEHMLFYNGDPANTANAGNTVLQAAYPNYMVKLNGSNILIRYTDTDNGPEHNQPVRNIGLRTILKTFASTNTVKYPFILALRHQPDAKDGSYAPGETDIEVHFKVRVN